MTEQDLIRPSVFSSYASISECSEFELVSASGANFLSNSNLPLEDLVTFRQTVNAEAIFDPDLSFGLEVDIREKGFEWMSLEIHIPITLMTGRERARINLIARAASRDVISLGHGGHLHRGRGFECFTLRDFTIGQRYKLLSMEFFPDSLPIDEIEDGKLAVALYFNKTAKNIVTIADYSVEIS